MFLHSDEFGQHAAQPLRVDEVETAQQTAVLVMKQDAIVVKETRRLFNVKILDPLRVVRIPDGLAVYKHFKMKKSLPKLCA